jgi:signal peptidase I
LDANKQHSQLIIRKTIISGKLGDPGLDVMRVPVIGSSMEPVLRERDILLISLVLPETLACGDIIVRCKNELITHRVLVISHNQVYTRGDAHYWIDPMISGEDIWGIVTQIDRNGLIANMDSIRWKVINQMIGLLGRIQVSLTWQEQVNGKRRDRKICLHRFNYWFGKKVNWVILFLFAGRWLFHKPSRMEEIC